MAKSKNLISINGEFCIPTRVLPKSHGLYVATRAIKAWKGFCIHHRDGSVKPTVRQVTIPKGARIVVPYDQEYDEPVGAKLRTDRIVIGRVPASLFSPVNVRPYASGLHEDPFLDTRLHKDCARGFHVTWTRSQAQYWARL